MIEVAAAKTGQLAAVLASGLKSGDRVRIVGRDGTVAVVLAPGDLDALVATQLLLSKNGALAAIAEGLADLAAGRVNDWLTLRTEFGRPDDEQAGLQASAALVSHRARWDLELLPPAIAERCFDQLDALVSKPGRASLVDLPMTVPFHELRIAVMSGYRMVLREDTIQDYPVGLDGVAGQPHASGADGRSVHLVHIDPDV